MIVAGVGFRRSATADEIVALVGRAFLEAGLAADRLTAVATIDALADEPSFRDAARRLGRPGRGVDGEVLQEAAGRVRTRSERSLAAHGVGSVAEAAALGAAGPRAELVLARISSAAVTCALAAAPEVRS